MGNKASTQSSSEVLDHQIAVTQQEIQQFDEQIAQFKAELDSPNASQPDTEIERLQQSMARLSNSLNLEGHVELQEVQEVHQLVQDALDHRNKLMQEYTQLRGSDKIASPTIKYSELILKKCGTSNREEAELLIKLEELENELKELKTKQQEQEALAQQEAALNTLVQEVEALEQQVESTNDSELLELRQKCDELIEQIHTEDPDLDTVIQQQSKRQETISELQTHVEELAQNLAEEELAQQNFSQLEEEAANEDSELASELEQLKEANADLQDRQAARSS